MFVFIIGKAAGSVCSASVQSQSEEGIDVCSWAGSVAP